MLQTLQITLTTPLFWMGFAACGLLAIGVGIVAVVLMSRANDEPGPHARHLGTGAASSGSQRIGSDQIHPRSRRSELRSGTTAAPMTHAEEGAEAARRG